MYIYIYNMCNIYINIHNIHIYTFRLILASLKQLGRDITNGIIVKQNLFDVM